VQALLLDEVEPFNLERKESVLWRSIADMTAPAAAGGEAA
jgi:hypothetical protein